MSDDEQLSVFFYDFRSFLAVDSAFDESHKRRLQSNRAQQKLLRLPPTFFLNLATDVHDELVRRLSKSTQVALEHNSSFHPRRNISRQKLSRLSANRFNDLCFDILFEIERRNPILRDDHNSASISTDIKLADIDNSSSAKDDKTKSSGLSQNEVPPLLAAANIKKKSTNTTSNHTDTKNDITLTHTAPIVSNATENPTTSTAPAGPDSSKNDIPLTIAAASAPLAIIPTDKTSTVMSDATTTPIRTQFSSTDFINDPPAPPSSAGSWSCYSDVTHTPSTALTSPATSEAGVALKPLSNSYNPNSLPNDTSELPVVSGFQASTLTPTKSTLVEDSEDDNESELSDISDNEAHLGADRHPSVNAALRAWSIKNSSQADITSLNNFFNNSGELNKSGDFPTPSSSDSEEDNEDRYNLAHDFNIGEERDKIDLDEEHQDELDALTMVLSQNSVGNSINSDDMKRSYPLHSIEEERSPYIPQKFLKRASTSPYNNNSSNSGAQSPQERRRSLSETMSSSIPGGARSRSFNKLDGMFISTSKSNSPDLFQGSSAESLHQRTIKEKDDHIKALVDEGTRLDETINQLTKRLSESEAQRQMLQQENYQLHAALNDAENEKDKLEQKFKVEEEQHQRIHIESEEKSVQNKRDAEHQLAQKLKLKEDEFAQALIEKENEISQLRKNKDAELTHLLADKDNEIAKFKATREELELQHEKLKNKHAEVMSKQTEFAGSSANLTSQITLLESKLLKQDDVSARNIFFLEMSFFFFFQFCI